jgi:hypothetical protein
MDTNIGYFSLTSINHLLRHFFVLKKQPFHHNYRYRHGTEYCHRHKSYYDTVFGIGTGVKQIQITNGHLLTGLIYRT